MDMTSAEHAGVQFRYTQAEYRRGMHASYGRGAWLGLVPLSAISTALLTLVRFGWPRTVGYVELLILIASAAVLGALLGAVGQWAIGWVSWWYYNRRPAEWQTVAVALSPTAICIQGVGRRIEVPWSTLRAVEERIGLYLLVLPNRSVHFVPRRAMSQTPGTDETFRKLARAHLADRALLAEAGA